MKLIWIFFFFILIEIWDPGLTIREVGRRKIQLGHQEKMVSRPRRKIGEAREAGRERRSDQVPLSLLSSSHQGSQTAMALGTPPLFNECTWTFFPFSPSIPTLVLPSMELCPPFPQVSLSTSHFALGASYDYSRTILLETRRCGISKKRKHSR